MTSKLPINLENLLRQRQVEGVRIEYKAGWNPDAFLYANGVPSFSPGLRGMRYPGSASRHESQPQRGFVPCNAAPTNPVGTALRFNSSVAHDTQGRPHCIRPTLGWRAESRWDRSGVNGRIQSPIGVGLDEKLNKKLNELDLTEGRSTGISKIIKSMAANGSPAPEFETDEERSYFLIRLPVHEKAAAWVEEMTGSSGATTQETTQETTQKTTQKIVELLREQPALGRKDIAELIGDITEDGVKYHLNKLKADGVIRRIGPDKGGCWEIIESSP